MSTFKLPTPSRLAKDAFAIIHYESDEVLVNFLVSEKCNFSCDHCMMRSGPHAPNKWTTPEDVARAIEFARNFRGRSIRVNFVGGEPTLRPKLLEQLLCAADVSDVSIEMTTNGWWLRDHNAFMAVVSAVMRYLDDEKIIIRISSSGFHDKFRKGEEGMLSSNDHFEWALADGLPDLHRSLIKSIIARENTTCDSCGAALSVNEEFGELECSANENEDECHRAAAYSYDSIVGCNHEYNRFRRCVNTLRDAVQGDRLRVDRQAYDKATNNGRAADNSIASRGGGCAWDEGSVKFTLGPGGYVHDFCCNGGPSYGGNVRDGMKLVLRRTLLLQELHAEIPDKKNAPWYNNPSEYERCQECPGKSVKHFTKGSKWDKLVEKAYPILMRRLGNSETL